MNKLNYLTESEQDIYSQLGTVVEVHMEPETLKALYIELALLRAFAAKVKEDVYED